MSDVLICDMEMPKNCVQCPFRFRTWYMDEYLCLARRREKLHVNLNTGFDDACPLIPVPDHGRLIDAGALIKRLKDEKGAYFGYEAAVIGDAIEYAPTIIPASKEGET